jgi:hypothetical protein
VSKHEGLLRAYVLELAAAKTLAEGWWSFLLASDAARAGSSALGEQAVRRRWPDGPASHPRVLAVVRKYWLACDALNRSFEDAQVAGPEVDDAGDYRLVPDADPYEEERADDTDPDGYVEPHVFILEWLMDDDNEALAQFLSSLSYWPMGLDEYDVYV